jgi:hypothetical protein
MLQLSLYSLDDELTPDDDEHGIGYNINIKIIYSPLYAHIPMSMLKSTLGCKVVVEREVVGVGKSLP